MILSHVRGRFLAVSQVNSILCLSTRDAVLDATTPFTLCERVDWKSDLLITRIYAPGWHFHDLAGHVLC